MTSWLARRVVDALLAAHPDVDIYCGGVDESLNEKGYIVPVWEMPATVFRLQTI